MPHYNIVIETRADEEGGYIAEVVQGPHWTKGWSLYEEYAQDAYRYLRDDVEGAGEAGDTFDFMHVKV